MIYKFDSNDYVVAFAGVFDEFNYRMTIDVNLVCVCLLCIQFVIKDLRSSRYLSHHTIISTLLLVWTDTNK